MYYIFKTSPYAPEDYAADELKKYLRMMMPDGGDVRIVYDPKAKDGFRLGLMQDFGLDVSDAENTELDDILYIDTDEKGGIIAGSNPRSILLAVYEYLRQNGCRWLFPGVDGEFIPLKQIEAIRYRFKPSCRYRGQATEGVCSHPMALDVIDFMPKLGLNLFMTEGMNPYTYYCGYYEHEYNTENRSPETVTEEQVLQWKRGLESEIAKRGIQFHDVGHCWTADPFGIPSSFYSEEPCDDHEIVPESSRK